MNKSRELELKRIANDVRFGIIEGVYSAGCGHPGGSLSISDIMAYLYFGCNPGNGSDCPHVLRGQVLRYPVCFSLHSIIQVNYAELPTDCVRPMDNRFWPAEIWYTLRFFPV